MIWPKGSKVFGTFLFCALVSPCLGQVEGRTQSNKAACVESSGAVADGTFSGFEQIIDSADVIVEVHVDSVKTRPDLPGHSIVHRSEAVLSTNRVLKGPDSLLQFTLFPWAFGGMFEIREDQRFLLFLMERPPNSSLRDSGGVRSYVPLVHGMLCIDGNAVHVASEGRAALPEISGMPLEKAVSEIRSYLQTPRLRGRLIVEGAPFWPPQWFNLRTAGTWDRFKITIQAGNGNRGAEIRALPAGPTVSPQSGPRILGMESDGTFLVPLSEGVYRAVVTGVPDGYRVKAISMGTRDLLDVSLRIDANVLPELVVTLAPQ